VRGSPSGNSGWLCCSHAPSLGLIDLVSYPYSSATPVNYMGFCSENSMVYVHACAPEGQAAQSVTV
jgi:hypothetical protein